MIAATGGSQSARAAKVATSTIPILFVSGPNPIAEGLVASFNRPEANITGAAVYTSELMAKRLEILTKLVPRATTVAVLLDPTGFAADAEAQYVQSTARAFGRHAIVVDPKQLSPVTPGQIRARHVTASVRLNFMTHSGRERRQRSPLRNKKRPARKVPVAAPDHDLAGNRLRALSLHQREAFAVDNAAVHFDRRIKTGAPLFIGDAKGLRHSVEYLAAVRERLSNRRPAFIHLGNFRSLGRVAELLSQT